MATKLESVRVGGVTYAVSFPARIVDTGEVVYCPQPSEAR